MNREYTWEESSEMRRGFWWFSYSEKPKSKNPESPRDFRPITLQNNILKISEKFLLKLIMNHIKENKIIIKEQIGFKKKKSSLLNLLKLKFIKNKFKKTQNNLFLIFVDIEKAFDSLNHKILIEKLINYNFNIFLIEKIFDLIKKRKNYIKLKDKNIYIEMTNGIPQGSVISPILFNIFINDLKEYLNLENDFEETLFYADDICIVTNSKKSTKRKITLLEEWMLKNKLNLNKNKTKILVIENSKKKN